MTHHCNRCKLAIDTDKERYIVIQDYEGQKKLSKIWLHKKCWKELMLQKESAAKLQEKANQLISLAQNKLGDEESFTLV